MQRRSPASASDAIQRSRYLQAQRRADDATMRAVNAISGEESELSALQSRLRAGDYRRPDTGTRRGRNLRRCALRRAISGTQMRGYTAAVLTAIGASALAGSAFAERPARSDDPGHGEYGLRL